jgi:hypothetical protein
MKRTIGSLFVVFAALISALGASATIYQGSGEWKSCDSKKGEYEVSADIQKDGNNITITETVTFNENKTMNAQFVLQMANDDFFAVLNEAGEKVGNGYCWEMGIAGYKQCHSTSIIDKSTVEMTVEIDPFAIYRTGSKSKEGEPLVTWNDALYSQEEEEEVK